MECKVKKFCVVGIGTHASTKLVPALRQNNQNIVGVVSSKDIFDFNFTGPVFRTMEEAIAKTPSATVFLISSPPKLHFSQTAKALKSGRSVILEKPGFICEREAEAVSFIASQKQLVLAEAWMYKFSKVYSKLISEWATSKEKITSFDMVFTLPNSPSGTFRSSPTFGNSIIFDIGAYPVSLMFELGISPENFNVTDTQFEGKFLTVIAVKVRDETNKIDVNFVVGKSDKYENYVNVKYTSGRSRKYAPFFYGRPGTREIIDRNNAMVESVLRVEEENLFCAMLSQPLSVWRSSQAMRLKRMVEATNFLSKLETKYFSKNGE